MEIGLSLQPEEVRKKLARVSESPHWCCVVVKTIIKKHGCA